MRFCGFYSGKKGKRYLVNGFHRNNRICEQGFFLKEILAMKTMGNLVVNGIILNELPLSFGMMRKGSFTNSYRRIS